MALIDVDSLLTPVSESQPCGPDLEYDAAFLELEEAAKGKPEQQFGDTIIAAEEPEWRKVQTLASDLMVRTKDLRVAVHLLRSSTRLQGLGACAEGLKLIAGLLDTQWDHVHPMLDVDDGNDPTMRLNALAPLADGQAVLDDIRKAMISAGRVSLTGRDMELAFNKAQPNAGEVVPTLAGVTQALKDAQAQQPDLLDTLAVMAQTVAQIDQIINDRASISGPELRPLKVLAQVISDAAKQAQGAGAQEAHAADGASDGDASGGASGAGAGGVPGALRTRADAIAALQRVCQWIELNEPTNPAPLLIRRAERLMSKSFMDIIRDLAPDGLSQIERIAGSPDQ